MKKIFPLIAALIMLLTLPGCSGTGFDPRDLAQIYGSANEISAQTDIRTSYDVILDYTLSYRRGGGLAEVTILSPQILSGVTAHLKTGECTLVYDGTSVETLLPAVKGFSPADSFHGLIEDLINVLPVNYTFETINDVKLISLTYSEIVDEYNCEKRIWLDADTLAVKSGEFYLDGSLMMTMVVTSMGLY